MEQGEKEEQKQRSNRIGKSNCSFADSIFLTIKWEKKQQQPRRNEEKKRSKCFIVIHVYDEVQSVLD